MGRILTIILLILSTWLHWRFAAPWLVAHGSSTALDLAVTGWIWLVIGFGFTLFLCFALPWRK